MIIVVMASRFAALEEPSDAVVADVSAPPISSSRRRAGLNGSWDLITHRHPYADFESAFEHHGADEIKVVLEWGGDQ